jgi:hypothetical protein
MKEKWSAQQTLVVMVLSTVIGFVLWLLLMVLLWRLLQRVEVAVDFWAMVEALSAAVTAAALIGGGFVAYRQLDEGASTRYMDVADRLFGELNSADNIEARRWIFQQLPEDPEEGLRNLTPEGQANIKRTLNSMDRVAFLTQSGWIPENIVMPWMNPMIVKSWLKLKPYVERERRLRGESDYYEHASVFGERCIIWRAENLDRAEIEFQEDAL